MHITEEDLASWPDGTLSTRLQNGDVEYVTIEEGEMAEDRIITRDAQGNPDGGAPKTAVGDPIKDTQPARAKESALQPDAGSTDAEPTDEEERGAAETGTLEEQEFVGEEDDGPVSTADDIDNMTRKQIAAYIEENYPDHADEIDPTEPKPTVVAKAKKIIEDSAK